MTEPEKATPPRTCLAEVAAVFLKLGLLSFGGPAAHIGLLENEFVRRRRWLSHDEFLDLLGATNLIPGPNSTEMAIHLGLRRAGWAGLVVAGVCFILPAFLIVWAIAWAYQTYESLAVMDRLLYGLKPMIIAIVVQAMVGLARSALKSTVLGLLAIGCLALAAGRYDELAIIFGAGLAAALYRARQFARPSMAFIPLTAPAVGGAALGAAPVGLFPLFVVFLKTGAVLYGSGYVLLAFLQSDLVDRLGWLNDEQLLEAIAVGQVTPGPVFTTATFIGYRLAGSVGAIVATVGIFLPAFIFVALSGPLIPRLRSSPIAGAFLDGVNVASLALMAVVTWRLGQVALVDRTTSALFVAAAIALLVFRANSIWLIVAGMLLGLLFAP